MLISIVPNPCYLDPSDLRLKITTSPELWRADTHQMCDRNSICLGSSQFWSSSRHQMLLGSLNDNHIFVLRTRGRAFADPILYLGSRVDRSFNRLYVFVRSIVRPFAAGGLPSCARSLARSLDRSHGSQDESIVLSEPPTNRYLPSSGFLRVTVL